MGAESRRIVRLSARVLPALALVVTAVSGSTTAAATSAPRAPAPVAGEDWPMLHHDMTHSGVSPDPVVGAAAATAGLSLKWKTAAGSKIELSPAVVFNATLNKTLVYIQTWNNRLLALDAATGKIVWSFTEAGGKGANSSPAVDGNTVYVGATFAHTLWAVNATTGAPVCSYKVSGRIVASPVVADLGSGPEVFFGDTGLSENDNYGHEWAITGVGNPLGACKLVWSFNSWGDTNHSTYPGSWSPPALGYDSAQRPILVMGSSQPTCRSTRSTRAAERRSGGIRPRPLATSTSARVPPSPPPVSTGSPTARCTSPARTRSCTPSTS